MLRNIRWESSEEMSVYAGDTEPPLQTDPTPNGWTPAHDELLREWKLRAYVEYYIQTFSMYSLRKQSNWISYPIIVLSTTAGASIFSSDNHYIKYVAASMTLMSAILTGLLRQIQPGERSSQHNAASRRWSGLIRTIQQVLSTPVSQRPNVEVFLLQITSEMESVGSSQPEPLLSAIRKFQDMYGITSMDRLLFGDDIVIALERDFHVTSDATTSVHPRTTSSLTERAVSFFPTTGALRPPRSGLRPQALQILKRITTGSPVVSRSPRVAWSDAHPPDTTQPDEQARVA
jgi:hypothetical protein